MFVKRIKSTFELDNQNDEPTSLRHENTSSIVHLRKKFYESYIDRNKTIDVEDGHSNIDKLPEAVVNEDNICIYADSDSEALFGSFKRRPKFHCLPDLKGTESEVMMTLKKRLNFAIIGLGRTGSIHFRNIVNSNRCVLKYALDIDKEKLNSFQSECVNGETSFVSVDRYDTVLSDPNLDAVVITTPIEYHEGQILQALGKGKSVFCENPISTSVKSIEHCYELAQRNNLVLHCSLNRRFDPSIQQLKCALSDDPLGRIHLIKVCSRDSPKPSSDCLKTSNGIFHDCGVHDLDVAFWLLNRQPVTVYATAFTNDPLVASNNDLETVTMSLTFDDGTLTLIDLSRQSTYEYDQRVEIHGDKGMLESLNERPSTVQLATDNATILPSLNPSFPSSYSDSYVKSLDEFTQCLTEKRPSSVLCQDVVLLSRLAEACKRSCKSRQTVLL